MDKKSINIFILCLSVVLGFIVTMQFMSAVDILDNDQYTNQKIVALKEELDKVEKNKKDLEDQLKVLNQKVSSFHDNNDLISEQNKYLENELEKYKVISGGFDVKGEGLIITIENPSNDDPYFAGYSIAGKYELLLTLISNLNSAGAEAISINEQRYTSYTEIVPVADYLNINGKHVTAPIQVKAIGDKRTLDSAITFVEGAVDQLKSCGFNVVIEQENDIVIKGLSKLKSFKYLQVIENDVQ